MLAASLVGSWSSPRCTQIIRSAPKIELWGRGDAHKSPLPNGSPWRRLDGCDAGSERRARVGMLSGRRCHDRGRRLTSVVHDTIFIIQGAALGMPGYRRPVVSTQKKGVALRSTGRRAFCMNSRAFSNFGPSSNRITFGQGIFSEKP